MFRKRVFIVFLLFLSLAACNRDPNVAKRRYLESGNKYFDKGKYKEARLMYKDAIQKDRLFGPAYYKLGITEIHLGAGGAAVQDLRRAVELLPKTDNDHWDAMVRLSDIFLMAAGDKKEFQDEVRGYTEQLLKRDPKSFDGNRLLGDLNFRLAVEAYKSARPADGAKFLDIALDEFRKADSVRANDPGVSLQIARVLRAKGDAAGSEAMYLKVLDQKPAMTETYDELYRLYLGQKQFDKAETVWKRAFEKNPTQYDYLVRLALHYAALRRRDEMMTVLQQIKAHAKDYPKAYLTVGDFYLQMGDGDTAIKEYREGIDKDPKQKIVYLKHIVETQMRQNKKSDAADTNAQILKLEPNDNDAKAVAATLMLEKGQVNQALGELQQVLTRNPNNFVARLELAKAHRLRGEAEQARQELLKAIELRSDWLAPRLELADLQISRGEYEAAAKSADDILVIDRNSIAAQLYRSAAWIGQKKLPEARELLNTLVKANPNSPDVLFQVGVLNLSESKYKDAEAAFRKSYDLNPANLRGLMGIVEVYLAQNKVDQAVEMLQAESARAPNRLELHYAAANTAARGGKFDIAIAEYQKVLDGMDKNSRSRADVYLRMGETYRRKNDDANAVTALQKAREIAPDNDMVLTTLGLVLDHAGRWSEARQLYEAALKSTPNNGVVLNNLAFLMAEHGGDLDDALTKAQRAKQLLPNLWEVSDTLGWIYLKKNLADSAIDVFRDLTTKAPNHSTYRYHLGMALAQRGDKPKAIKELQEALKSSPEPAEKQKIQELLQRLQGA